MSKKKEGYIVVPIEVHKKFKEYCKKNGRTMKGMIEYIVSQEK